MSLRTLTDEHLRCRGGYNHAWSDCPPPIDMAQERKPGCWQCWLRCDRCQAIRLDTVRRSTGALEGRRYWLPEGYSDPDLKGLIRDAFRKELGARRNNGNGNGSR